MDYDYIIVGAGGAGCALAYRLSEDPDTTVLLLENGGPDTHPLVRIPKGFFFLLGAGLYSYTYPTLPTGPNGTVEYWQRGKMAGGSTSINGMQYQRGDPSFWNDLEAAGNPGWGWGTMTPVFRSMEDHELGASATRGAGGPLHISVTRESDELNEAFFAANEQMGLTRVDDINEVEGKRVGYMPNTIKNGLRHSSYRAFLRPALKRANLTYVDHTRVSHVLLDGQRATGVRVRQGSMIRDYEARQEVILSAGAVETPLLLERSGIGAPQALAEAGLPVHIESPNVGERVIEQRTVSYQARINQKLGYTHKLSSPLKQAVRGASYLVSRSGVVATGAYDIGAFFASDPNSSRADLQVLMNPLALDLSAAGLTVANEPGLNVSGYLLHPTTRSSVHSSGSEPENPPVIDSRYLENDYDRSATVALLDQIRTMAEQSPLAELIVEEQAPGPSVQSPEQVIAHSWASGHIAHGVGSAAMGPNDDDVVDAQLRVRGVNGLRVADTSVFPTNPGNTAGPTMALGWRAADIIRS